jgi:hypothetical protein
MYSCFLHTSILTLLYAIAVVQALGQFFTQQKPCLFLSVPFLARFIAPPMRAVCENRTRVACLEDRGFTTKLIPHWAGILVPDRSRLSRIPDVLLQVKRPTEVAEVGFEPFFDVLWVMSPARYQTSPLRESRRVGSNHRHPGYEPSALPTELRRDIKV